MFLDVAKGKSSDFEKETSKCCTHNCQNHMETVICKRECAKFIPSAKDRSKCSCGHSLDFHKDESPTTIHNKELDETHWSSLRHTHLLPTDAYGTLEFQGGPHPHKARYIRLSHDTPPSVILELLTSEWGLGPPKLLITIHGGKTNFELQPKLKKIIRNGLLKAARTTGAWVFTGGTDTGVIREVGEALGSKTNFRESCGQIVSVGIAPWGIVEPREDLIGKNKDVRYHPLSSPKSRYTTLNSHHSFFLLVDNGTVGRHGPEVILRRKFENFISKQRIEARGGLATPVVCVVIEGGPHTIRQVLEYVTNTPPLPVIVCDGTGRAADILAFVHKYAECGHNVLENNRPTIVNSLESVFDLGTENAERLFSELMKIAKKKDMITVFRHEEGSELDQSILYALLNSRHQDPPEQLSLALTWDRVDIARSFVFNEDVEWPEESLEQAMMDALVNDRVDFVKLLIEQGVSMLKFLTVERLEELYNLKLNSANSLQYILKDVKPTVPRDYKYKLMDIGLVLNKLMGGAFRSIYTRKKFWLSTAYSTKSINSLDSGNFTFSNSSFMSTSSKKKFFEVQKDPNAQPVFEYPFSDLMVWAVLTQRQKLSLLLWEHGEEAVAKALVAAKLYKALAHEGADDDLETEVYEELKGYAKEYETLALELLDQCYQQDEGQATQLLTYELKYWSKKTCLSLAVAVNHRAFLAHPCSQILLADLWLGGLRTRKSNNVKVILGLLFPPVILFLGFRSRQELRSMPQTVEEHYEDVSNSLDDDFDIELDFENIDMRNDIDPELLSPNYGGGGGRRPSFSVPRRSSIFSLPQQNTSSPRRPSIFTIHQPSRNSSLRTGSNASHLHMPNSTPVMGSVCHPHRPSVVQESTLSQASTCTLHDHCYSSYSVASGSDVTFSDPSSKELPARTKMYEFYNAPITKFWAYAGAFAVFLCLFTYVVLVKLPKHPHWPEWYVLAYMCSYLVEKFREILSSEPATLRQKLEIWMEKMWNVFDVIFLLLYLIGFILRVMAEGDLRDAGRIILCVDIIYWYLKILEILSANKYLGPLVMMMGKMIIDMAYFVILLFVVLMAFGVCRQSILFPDEPAHWILMRHIFFEPYFMLYGEVFAAEIDPPCGGEDEIKCAPGRWITILVMSMYLMVANILLINLLIAVFNNIYTYINSISHQVWMFQRFRVVMDFEGTPCFPPPLIILSHICRTFKYFYQKNWKRKPFIHGHGLKRFITGENLERLHDFEKECLEMYKRDKEQKFTTSTEERVRLVSKRTEALSQRVDDVQSKVAHLLTSTNNLNFHLKRLHQDVRDAAGGYDIVHRFMVSYLGEPVRRSSGQDSISMGQATSSSNGLDSRLSLQDLLQNGQRERNRLPSDEYLEEDVEETEDEGEEGNGEETIHGRNGDLILKMNIPEVCKKKRKGREKRKSRCGLERRFSSLSRKESEDSEVASFFFEDNFNTSFRDRRKQDTKRTKELISPRISLLQKEQESDFETLDNEGDSLFDIAEANHDNKSTTAAPFKHPSRPSLTIATHGSKPSPTTVPSLVSRSSKPFIQVIPPTTPPINPLTAEYASLGDELEQVCVARLTPSASPRLLAELQYRRIEKETRPRHYSDSAASPTQIDPSRCPSPNPLRDAEEADYNLMEGIIERRMRRDSKNLDASLEELYSIFGLSEEDLDEEDTDEMEFARSRRTLKRHSTVSLNLPRPGAPPRRSGRRTPSRFSKILTQSSDTITTPASPVVQLTVDSSSPQSSSPPSGEQSPDIPASNSSHLLQVPDFLTADGTSPTPSQEKIPKETEC